MFNNKWLRNGLLRWNNLLPEGANKCLLRHQVLIISNLILGTPPTANGGVKYAVLWYTLPALSCPNSDQSVYNTANGGSAMIECYQDHAVCLVTSRFWFLLTKSGRRCSDDYRLDHGIMHINMLTDQWLRGNLLCSRKWWRMLSEEHLEYGSAK